MSNDMNSVDININIEAEEPHVEGPHSMVADGLSLKKTRITSSTEEYKKHLDKAEILKLRVELDTFEDSMEYTRNKIKELTSAINTLLIDLEPLEKQLKETQGANEPLKAKYSAIEKEWYQLKAKAADSGVDKLAAIQTELELAKLKPPIVANELQIEHLEQSIAPFKEHEVEAKRSLSVEREAMAKKESKYLVLKENWEKAKVTWALKWEDSNDRQPLDDLANKGFEKSKASNKTPPPPTTDGVVDGKPENEVTNLKNELQQAKEEIKKKSREIEIMKSAKTSLCFDNENVSIIGKTDTTQSNMGKAKASDTEKEIQALKDQIEQMKPLYWIGYWTRGRKIDLDLRNSGAKQYSKANIDKGVDAFRDHDVLADATLYMEFSPQKRLHPGEFVNTYGISPTIVWSNRNFKSYINILNWRAEMTSRFPHVYDTKKFNDNLQKILPKMFPNFQIRSDDDIQGNEEYLKVYEILKAERTNALAAEYKAGGPIRPRPQRIGTNNSNLVNNNGNLTNHNGNLANNNNRFATPKQRDLANSGSTA